VPLLEVENLSAGYGFPVLMGISFGVEEGETCVLFGLNGAGKTTTVATIAGQIKPDGGAIPHSRAPNCSGGTTCIRRRTSR